MPYATYRDDHDYLLNKYRCQDCPAETGLTQTEVIEKLKGLFMDIDPWVRHPVAKAMAFDYVCKNMQLDVNPHDDFPKFGIWDRLHRPLYTFIWRWNSEVNAYHHREISKFCDERNNAGFHMIWKDFDHSVPDWDSVFPLGFTGLKERARIYRKKHETEGTLTEDVAAFFDGIDMTLQAILDCIGRFIDYARKAHPDNPRVQREVACLEQLRIGPPKDFYQCLMLIYLTFMFGEHIDCIQVRSLSNMDRMLMPYYEADLRSGRYTEEDCRQFMACFLMQFGSINNYWNHPLFLGGVKEDGSTEINQLSYMLLEVFGKLHIPTPKVQIKLDDNTPDDFIDLALRMIRDQQASICFVGTKGMRRALLGRGMTDEHVRICNIHGCYEFSPRGMSNGTGAGHLNMLKPIELIFNNGKDLKTGLECKCGAPLLKDIHSFEDFYGAYTKYVENLTEGIIKVAVEYEEDLELISPANVFSSTIINSLKTGKDAFAKGCVFNGSTILITGIGTAVDALMAVKKLVFEDRQLTLEEFAEILRNNWEGHEELRQKALHLKEKYGNGIAEVDQWAAFLARYVGYLINGRPNGRGGRFSASGHCAKQYIQLGKRTAATPDGRKAGEEMSKNVSPTMGADRNGVTALIKSMTTIDPADLPADFPLDVMMHPTTVRGEEGIAAMHALVRSYASMNGIQIQFNIFDTQTLLEAQKEPEKYTGLQVRVCGWSTKFVTMDKSEQDAYIERSKNICE